MEEKKTMMLTGGGMSSIFMYNGLKDDITISSIVIEGKGDRKKFIERRIKKLGLFKVLGQIAFQLSVPKILERNSQKRIEDIKSIYNLNSQPIEPSIIKKVDSVNSNECIEFIKKEKPDIIIVNGTRIISKKVLSCTEAIFINTHAGITPRYRGVHGGYWAIANGDKENCGVTVHLVDSGIDTGGVLLQKTIAPSSKDNFVTYTYLQIGEGIQLMKRAVSDFIDGKLKEKESQTTDSKLWSHPTLWFYLKKRILNGIK